MLCTLVGKSDLVGLTILKFGLNSYQCHGLIYQERQAAAGKMAEPFLSRHQVASPRGQLHESTQVTLYPIIRL